MKSIEELRQQQYENRKIMSTQLENFEKKLQEITRDYYEQSIEYLKVIKRKENEIELLKEKNKNYEECIGNGKNKKDLFKNFDLSKKEESLLEEVIEFSNGDYQDLFKWGLKKDLLEQEDIDLIRKLINKVKLEDLKKLELIEFLEMYEFLSNRGFKREKADKVEKENKELKEKLKSIKKKNKELAQKIQRQEKNYSLELENSRDLMVRLNNDKRALLSEIKKLRNEKNTVTIKEEVSDIFNSIL